MTEANHHVESTRVGFTGTRLGMTDAQKATVRELLRYDDGVVEAHHGDCVGADGDFHDIVHGMVPVIIHPPKDPKLRAWCDGDVLPEKSYLARNRDIVAASDWLIATPAEMAPQGKGGTWYTIRYANSQGRLVTIVWPNGTAQYLQQSDGSQAPVSGPERDSGEGGGGVPVASRPPHSDGEAGG